jgi:hypothetical protein
LRLGGILCEVCGKKEFDREEREEIAISQSTQSCIPRACGAPREQ